MILFSIFLFCFLSTLGLYLFATRKTDARRLQYRERLNKVLLHSSHSEDVDVRRAREELLSEIPLLNRVLVRIQIATRLKKYIDQADMDITVMRLVLFSLAAGMFAALAVNVMTISWLPVIVVGTVAMLLPAAHVYIKRRKRLKAFLEHLPDALELMARSLAAGHAFSESLRMVSTEMPDPIATEFRRTFDEHNLGLSMKLALDALTERVPLIDLRMCVTATLIQRETGGNLAEILEKVAHTIRERFRIMEDLNTLTTSSRMSSWVLCGLPIFVAFMVTALNPTYMQVFWQDPRGHKLIAIAIVMQIIGMLIVRKIMQIKI